MFAVSFSTPLIIDWSQTHFYNTIMAIAAGAGLAVLADIMNALRTQQQPRPLAWMIALLLPGVIMFATGLYMVLAWPLGPRFAHDNIIFGEPSLVLGVLLLGLGLYFYLNREAIHKSKQPARLVAQDIYMIRYLLYGAGGALIAIAAAAVQWNLFVAPVEEPLAGFTAAYNMPWLTNLPIAALFASTGVYAIAIPRLLARYATTKRPARPYDRWLITILRVLAWAFIVIGVLVTYTHIGMVINTSDIIQH